MTDRYAGFIVTLDRDTRSDDAEATITAIKQIKGVLDVQPVTSSFELHIAEDRARNELIEKVWKALNERPNS